MMKLQDLITQLVENHIQFTSEYVGETLVYTVGGFCKSGTVTLMEDNDRVFCIARYGETDEIRSFDDLLEIAWTWYTRSGNTNPPEPWGRFFFTRKWVEIQQVPQFVNVRGV